MERSALHGVVPGRNVQVHGFDCSFTELVTAIHALLLCARFWPCGACNLHHVSDQCTWVFKQVNNEGNVVLDTFVAPKEAVVDYRTWVSGVRPQDLVGAPSLEEVQQRASELLQGRVIVGHSISKDFKVLMLSHPRKLIRDTARWGCDWL